MTNLAERLRRHALWLDDDPSGVRLVEHGSALKGQALLSPKLDRADLSGSDMRGVDLTCGSLDWATLSGADARNAILTRASVRHASLSHVNMRGAILDHANLANSVGHRAKFRHAIMAGADCTGADFTNADFRGSYMEEVCMFNARLGGAKLLGAKLHDALLGYSTGIRYATHHFPAHNAYRSQLVVVIVGTTPRWFCEWFSGTTEELLKYIDLEDTEDRRTGVVSCRDRRVAAVEFCLRKLEMNQ